MKTVLIDECLPRKLRRWLKNVTASTVQDCGWAGVKNGMLLSLAEGNFEVFLTSDRKLKYQQNLKDRSIAIIVVPTNDAVALQEMIDTVQNAVNLINAGEFVEL